MKAILISINPRHVANILGGIKWVEIRKSMPKCELPIDVYIYCTKANHIGFLSKKYVGKVVAKFTLTKVDQFYYFEESLYEKACLTYEELIGYLGDKIGYAWHIDNLERFKEPKDLKQFYVFSHSVNGVGMNGKDKTFDVLKPITKAPQSYCYIRDVL